MREMSAEHNTDGEPAKNTGQSVSICSGDREAAKTAPAQAAVACRDESADLDADEQRRFASSPCYACDFDDTGN